MAKIMYVCDQCADDAPEACGHYERANLRIIPTGQWLCENCFDEWRFDRADDEFRPMWSDFPPPPEYVEKA